MSTTGTRTKGRGRGFASMTKEQRTFVASKGGKAAWKLGTAHRFTRETAAEAGRKGGSTSRRGKANKEQAQ